MKIRTRLTLQFMLISAGISLLALLFIFNQFKQYVENEFFTHLENKGRMTAEMVLRHESQLKVLPKTKDDNTLKLPSIGNISIFNDRYQCVFTLNNATDLTPLPLLQTVDRKGHYRFQQGHFQALGVTLNSSSGQKYIIISEDTPDFTKLDTLRNILLLSFLLVIAAVSAGGWFYAGQALQPVSQIVHEVETILPTDLSHRLKQNNNHDELGHLVSTFNRLLDRIERAFQMQKGFIANVSHELKNPLATMDAQLQLARHKPRSVNEYNLILGSLHEDVKNITDTADKLLQLAKIHSSTQSLAWTQVRLDELIYQSQDNLLKNNPQYHIHIEFRELPDNEEDLCVQGNESLLRTALMNLLDNACKFSGDHKATIILDCNAPYQLQIQDKGQGIAQEDLPYIFEPFFRSPQSGHKKGSGIGLSLVQSILKLHHITIEVQSSLEQGTTFLLHFPSQKNQQTVIEQATNFSNLSFQHDTKPAASSLKQSIRLFFFMAFLSISSINCSDTHKSAPPQYQQGLEVVQEWNAMFLDLVQYSSGYRPPVSARMFAYVGLAAWETTSPIWHQTPTTVTAFDTLKHPMWQSNQPFIIPIALNAVYASLAKYYFPHTSYKMIEKQERLSQKWEEKWTKAYSADAIKASRDYGISMAKTIFEWSATDAIGHQAFLFNYNPQYKSPKRKGSWQSNGITAMPALLPSWGKARTFVSPPTEFEASKPIEFSDEQNSVFFAQAMEVYTTSKPMTDEKTWVAEFWGDDYPNLSFCAASRWIAITHQALEHYEADFQTALETYLKVGLALNDVAVKVWREKYTFNLLRPETYIQKHIDATWKPLHDTPPFPAYPSGHSAFGAAAASILESILGQNKPLTDRSHENSTVFMGKPRSFSSFKAMAEENALSRLYMGVHYRMDCEEGLRLGYAIGRKVATLKVQPNTSVVHK
ncbi:MAG: phosphatase PAP2 family protein [Saprospiraceae bacterium]|nr:phosphatase PAP2 family protein [Saprospiraceae bacterium]